MALFREEIAASWRERRLGLASETHLTSGIHYHLFVDGEPVATTRNLFKRPGRFEVRYRIDEADGPHEIVGRIHQRLLRTTMTLEVDGRTVEADAPTSEQQADARRGRWIRRGVVGLVLVLVAVVLAAVLPTRTAPLAAAWPASTRDAGRRRATCDTLVTREGCEPVAVTGRRDLEVTFPSHHPDRGLEALHGTLSLPEGPAPPHPGVVLIGGSGGHPRDPELRGGLVVHHEPFRAYDALTELLVRQGFAVLRYDKRTCRPCYPRFEPDLRRFRFEHFEDDVRDAHAWLRARGDVDGDNLVLVGHSQGGAIAARLGGELDGVRAVVMLAGSIDPFRQALSGQLRRVAALRQSQLDIVNAWTIRRSADAFDACLSEAATAPEEPMACLHNVTFRAFEQEAERAATTLPSILALEVPFFAAQGQLDRNIDPASLETIASAVASRDAEIHVLAGVGHSLVHEADRDAPRLSPELADDLNAFVASVPRHARE